MSDEQWDIEEEAGTLYVENPELVGAPMKEWFVSHDNIVLLAQWMLANGYDAEAIVYMIEKPWKYSDEYVTALSESLSKGEEDIDE